MLGKSKLIKRIFKVIFADGSRVYVEGYNRWDATQRAKEESKFTTVDTVEVKDWEICKDVVVKPILVSETADKRFDAKLLR